MINITSMINMIDMINITSMINMIGMINMIFVCFIMNSFTGYRKDGGIFV
jgi:hypothetical protein